MIGQSPTPGSQGSALVYRHTGHLHVYKVLLIFTYFKNTRTFFVCSLLCCCVVVGGGGFFGFFCFAFGALLAENEKYQHTCRLNLRGFFFFNLFNSVTENTMSEN